MHLAEAPIGLSLFAPSLTIHVTSDILHATLCALHLTIHVTPDNDILHVTLCMWYLTCVHLAPAPICLPLFALSYHASQFLFVCHSLLCIWLCILLPPISFHCTSIPPIFTSFHLLTPYSMLHIYGLCHPIRNSGNSIGLHLFARHLAVQVCILLFLSPPPSFRPKTTLFHFEDKKTPTSILKKKINNQFLRRKKHINFEEEKNTPFHFPFRPTSCLNRFPGPPVGFQPKFQFDRPSFVFCRGGVSQRVMRVFSPRWGVLLTD